MTFNTYEAALAWARKHAREHCFPYHFWRVERDAYGQRLYRVAVRSKNTGALCAYCHA